MGKKDEAKEAAIKAQEKKVITQEDLDNNPDLVEQGVKVGDEVTVTIAPPEDVTEHDEDIAPYFELYPDTNTFYRSTDGNVFISKNLADVHQKTLGGDNKLQTFKRK